MPITPTYPGVYIEEIPSGVRTIVGVSTSDTAFVDFFRRGPVDRAVRISGLAEFERVFGGLDRRSEASYAIQQFFLNGGSIAWVIRVVLGANTAQSTLQNNAATDVLRVLASSPGTWGNSLRVGIGHVTPNADVFNLVVREVDAQNRVVRAETFRNLSLLPTHPRFVESVLAEQSELLRADMISSTNGRPQSNEPPATDITSVSAPDAAFVALTTPGSDGDEPGSANWNAGAPAALNSGMQLLNNIAPFVFNLLCLPAAANLPDGGMQSLLGQAMSFCQTKRAFLLVDIPAEGVTTEAQMRAWLDARAWLRADGADHAAIYFPRLTIPDSLSENRPRNVGASGTMAGVYARTDAERGIWKAPAGSEASLRGATLVATLTDLDNGALNPLGINALRTFPVFGNVAWGARTLDGADIKASEYKYVPVRRTALYIAESLYQGLQWVVFEPNDEPLWAQIRLNAGAFMNNLFRQGAFQGKTPRDAYFVKCDRETTTQNDINLGIVNILVGFAPLKPAEFVIVKLQQMAGQIQV